MLCAVNKKEQHKSTGPKGVHKMMLKLAHSTDGVYASKEEF
jgi:hypothetical protein